MITGPGITMLGILPKVKCYSFNRHGVKLFVYAIFVWLIDSLTAKVKVT